MATPIDLSTVYIQMDTVAKFNASQNQLTHAAEQFGIDKAARENLEKSRAVKEAAKDNANATTVKQDGHQGASRDGDFVQEKKERKKNPEEEVEAPRQIEISDPRLGQRIDITG